MYKKTPTMQQVPSIRLGDLQISGRGQKSIPLYQADGKQLYVFPGTMDIPFNASAFQNSDATRVNLCMTPDDNLTDQIHAIEGEVKKQLIPRMQEMFGAQAGTLEKQDEWFQSVIKDSKGYQTMRTKINLIGKYQTRVWNQRKESMPLPSDWSAFQVKPKLWIRAVWIMGKEAGLVIDCTDAQLEEIQRSCPF